MNDTNPSPVAARAGSAEVAPDPAWTLFGWTESTWANTAAVGVFAGGTNFLLGIATIAHLVSTSWADSSPWLGLPLALGFVALCLFGPVLLVGIGRPAATGALAKLCGKLAVYPDLTAALAAHIRRHGMLSVYADRKFTREAYIRRFAESLQNDWVKNLQADAVARAAIDAQLYPVDRTRKVASRG